MPTELAQLLREAAPLNPAESRPRPALGRRAAPSPSTSSARRRQHRRRRDRRHRRKHGVACPAGSPTALSRSPASPSVCPCRLSRDCASTTPEPRSNMPAFRGPADEDPTEAEAVVVAQEPPPDVVVSPGHFVGLRTALVTPELCTVLRDLPDFSNGATWGCPSMCSSVSSMSPAPRWTPTRSGSSTTSGVEATLPTTGLRVRSTDSWSTAAPAADIDAASSPPNLLQISTHAVDRCNKFGECEVTYSARSGAGGDWMRVGAVADPGVALDGRCRTRRSGCRSGSRRPASHGSNAFVTLASRSWPARGSGAGSPS